MESETPGLDRPDTSNFLNWVEIKNFKSIKDLRLDCKRVNIFIGKPNVGKSNILEGLGLLGSSYDMFEPILKRTVRFKSFSNLFYDDDFLYPIEINSDKLKAQIQYHQFYERYFLIIGQEEWFNRVINTINKNITALSPKASIDDFSALISGLHSAERVALARKANGYEEVEVFRFAIPESGKHASGRENVSLYNPVKVYKFRDYIRYDIQISDYLMPPNGENLFAVVNHDEQLRKDISDLFKDNSLEFVLSKKDKAFWIQKRIDGYVYSYPYLSVADTFQRFVFYISAIESNKNSVIVFEEPEVHSFPPYTQEMAYRMIYDESNQYFISTHSPYMLHPFIEKMDYKDLNVFITYYQDYQTRVRALTEEEFRDILDYSTNVFFNLRKFEPNA